MAPWKKYGFLGQDYILVTLHRPSNVDDRNDLGKYMNMLNHISKNIPIIFPAHPRTKNNIVSFDILNASRSFILMSLFSPSVSSSISSHGASVSSNKLSISS